ncbi:hypothetical protein ACFX2J_042067 [Malus domestica]
MEHLGLFSWSNQNFKVIEKCSRAPFEEVRLLQVLDAGRTEPSLLLQHRGFLTTITGEEPSSLPAEEVCPASGPNTPVWGFGAQFLS